MLATGRVLNRHFTMRNVIQTQWRQCIIGCQEGEQ
jgi:hypothetical protein